jgi:AraC-like DNA-binding protein
MLGGASLTFTEPHQYQERIRPADAQIIPTERGNFKAVLSQMNLHHLTLQSGSLSLTTAVRAELHKSRTSIIFQTGTTPAIIKTDGIDLSSDLIAQGAPGEEHFLQIPSDCSWATLTLTPETYAAARAALIGDEFDPTVRTGWIRPSSVAMARLRALHQRVMSMIPTGQDHGTHPEVARAAEQALLATVVDCLMDESDGLKQPLGDRNITAVMRSLYELLDESEDRPLYLTDVCVRLGVSQRTLYKACFDHVGLSPRRFLWSRRMQLARRALLATDERAATVTQIAADLGFWEFGRFSVRYKWLFGESPSATLRRRHL